jgi:hypothetical protein
VRVILDLSERPDAVARPFRRPDQGDRPLPHGTEVAEVFDAVDHSLLILGEPGAGKTTLLLELARDLLDRAAQDPAHPIPVIFPLSTWADSLKRLEEWLADELKLRYDVPRKIAQAWVASEEILPLLDGLDEVRAERRAACVEAINAFRKSHGLLPLAVACRTADYEALAEPLRLHSAILVRPLTEVQVNTYLDDLGVAGEPIRAAIRKDRSLRELLDNPLLLNVVAVAHAGQSGVPALANCTMFEQRAHLFESYVNEMLQRRNGGSVYTSEQIMHWLSWLACQMDRHSHPVFYLELMQPNWLSPGQREAVRFCCLLAVGLPVGVVMGLVTRPWIGLAFGLGIGVKIGNVDFIRTPDIARWSWRGFRREGYRGLASGMKFVLFGGLIGLAVALEVGLTDGLIGGLAFGLFGGLVWGLIDGLAAGLTSEVSKARMVPIDPIRKSARNALLGTTLGGLVSGVVIGLVGGLIMGLLKGLADGLMVGLIGGLVGAFLIGSVVGMRAGGEACLQHVILRLWLIRNGSTPWNYVRFLDHAAERNLLRKVGGGYAFIHRMFLDHFAARYR